MALDTDKWWDTLEEQWKKAFNEGFFQSGPVVDQPAPDALQALHSSPAIRLAGPTATYPNMSFELTNLSGLAELKQLETLVVINHNITSPKELKDLRGVKALFLYYNELTDLEGISQMTDLETLYVQGNHLKSIKEVENFLQLKEFYCNYNQLESLDGLVEAHSKSLTGLYCLPNDELPQKEVIRVQNELGILCRRS